MMTINIRSYSADDLPLLADLFRRSVRQCTQDDYNEEQRLAWAPDELDMVAWAHKRLSKPTWVAEVNGVVAGFIDLEPDGHVDMLYVHPDHARKGLATALLIEAQNAAQRQGNTRMYSEVSLTARRAFEKCGFVVVARQEVTVRGQTMVNLRMERSLA
jgi:putative acetyltransferase